MNCFHSANQPSKRGPKPSANFKLAAPMRSLRPLAGYLRASRCTISRTNLAHLTQVADPPTNGSQSRSTARSQVSRDGPSSERDNVAEAPSQPQRLGARPPLRHGGV